MNANVLNPSFFIFLNAFFVNNFIKKIPLWNLAIKCFSSPIITLLYLLDPNVAKDFQWLNVCRILFLEAYFFTNQLCNNADDKHFYFISFSICNMLISSYWVISRFVRSSYSSSNFYSFNLQSSISLSLTEDSNYSWRSFF